MGYYLQVTNNDLNESYDLVIDTYELLVDELIGGSVSGFDCICIVVNKDSKTYCLFPDQREPCGTLYVKLFKEGIFNETFR